jgi:tripartite ATP-independent transporter DctP family solute receptor
MKLKYFIAGIFAAGLLSTSVGHAVEIREHTMRFSLQPPKGTSQYAGVKKFSDLIHQKSNGKMTVKVFEGGTLGSDLPVLSSMVGGTLDFVLTSTGNLAGYDKSFSIFDMFFAFNNEKEADFVVDGPVGQNLFARLPAKGLKGLAYAELGFRHIHNSKRPIAKLEDIRGLKLRTPTMAIYLDFMNQLGANAITMPFTELYQAMEIRAIDGATNPTDNILSTHFNDVQKYLSLSRHGYGVMAFVMSGKSWNKLNVDEQNIIQEAANEARDFQRKASRDSESNNLAELGKLMKINEVPPEELDRMRLAVAPVVEKWSKEVGVDLYNQFNTELAKARAKK